MGNTANNRYAKRNSVRFWKRFSFMASPFVADGAHALHPVVEDEAQQQDDEEINQRERCSRPQVNWPTALVVRYWLRKVVALPGPPPVSTKGSVVDHEAVHEAQQHGNHQHAAHLGQLDVAEHRELAGTVDARSLVVARPEWSAARQTPAAPPAASSATSISSTVSHACVALPV